MNRRTDPQSGSRTDIDDSFYHLCDGRNDIPSDRIRRVRDAVVAQRTALGERVALLGVSEFLPEERTNAILAIRLTVLALAGLVIAFAAVFAIFLLNNSP